MNYFHIYKLNEVIFKYLDKTYGALKQKKGGSVDILFYFPGDEYSVLGWEKPGNLYVSDELITEISDFFGMDATDSKKVIGEWG